MKVASSKILQAAQEHKLQMQLSFCAEHLTRIVCARPIGERVVFFDTV